MPNSLAHCLVPESNAYIGSNLQILNPQSHNRDSYAISLCPHAITGLRALSDDMVWVAAK